MFHINLEDSIVGNVIVLSKNVMTNDTINPVLNKEKFNKLLTQFVNRNIFVNYDDLIKLSYLDDKNIDLLITSLNDKFGVVKLTKFLTDEVYTEDEYVDILIEYLLTYGLDVVPEKFRDNIIKEKKKINSSRDFKVYTYEQYIDEVNNKILYAEKSPFGLEIEFIKSFDGDINFEMVKNKDVLLEIYKSRSSSEFRRLNHLKLYIDEVFFKDKKSLKTSEKRFILKNMEKIKIDYDNEYYPNKKYWHNIEKMICPTMKKWRKYKNRFNTESKSFGQLLNEYINNENDGKFLLKNKGLFIRNLKHLVTKRPFDTLELFDKIDDFKLKQLLELYSSLSDIKENVRTFKIKSKYYRKVISEEKKNELNKTNKILKSFIKEKVEKITKEKLNFDFAKNEEYNGIALPLKIQNLPISDKPVTRGSRFKLENNSIRVFCAWKAKDNKAKKIDLDLSMYSFSDDKSNYNYKCSWANYELPFAKHSGDFTACRSFDPEEGIITAEFIDVNLKKCNEDFLVFNLYNFNNHSFKEYDCYFGYIIDFDPIKKDLPSSQRESYGINLNNAVISFKVNEDTKNYSLFAIDVKNKELMLIAEELIGNNTGESEGIKLFNKYQFYRNTPLLNDIATFDNSKEKFVLTNEKLSEIADLLN